jgi:hypothetical protein
VEPSLHPASIRNHTIHCIFLAELDSTSADAHQSCGHRTRHCIQQGPTLYDTRYPCSASGVMVVTVMLDTCEMEQRASPRNPRVLILSRSSKLLSLLVVCRWQRMGRSAFCRRDIVSTAPSPVVGFHHERTTQCRLLELQGANAHPDAVPIVCDLQQLVSTLFHSD